MILLPPPPRAKMGALKITVAVVITATVTNTCSDFFMSSVLTRDAGNRAKRVLALSELPVSYGTRCSHIFGG